MGWVCACCDAALRPVLWVDGLLGSLLGGGGILS